MKRTSSDSEQVEESATKRSAVESQAEGGKPIPAEAPAQPTTVSSSEENATSTEIATETAIKPESKETDQEKDSKDQPAAPTTTAESTEFTHPKQPTPIKLEPNTEATVNTAALGSAPAVAAPASVPSASGEQDPSQKPLGVEDALAYLDKVKRQFRDKPDVYNQFLDIMKNFKAEQINTPGVIECVCKLFQGHNDLILGFNTFLPPGFKIEVNSGGGVINAAQPQDPKKTGTLPGGGARPAPNMSASNRAASMNSIQSPRTVKAVAEPFVPQVSNDSAAAASAQGQPVEFDHAINYVTKIKTRFANDSDTYKAFLDILHSYQNEQKSINEVLEQVSKLFKDHADLLREFTYFLPDAVRESAKSVLEKRAASFAAGARGSGKVKSGVRKKEKKTQSLHDMEQDESRVPQLERSLLSRIKAAIGTRETWGEFLKCLELFAQELISRSELLSLVVDIFGERGDLLEEFDRLLASRGATDDPVESAWFSMPLQDIDFTNCRRSTPSYRSLPAAFPKAPCSERTAMCRSVLNDAWVSVPLGSEDSSSKSHRRNIHEEALFKCEDDRYEVDMIIDSTKSAIRVLESLAQEIELLKNQQSKFRYRLERRTFNVIQLKAIARVYGDHGTEMLELLRRNPAGAIPVILRRLKSKDLEWSKRRQEMNRGWRETMEKNYLRSLDHRSFYFKQSEKRLYSTKVLINEMKDKLKSMDDTEVALKFPSPLIHLDAWSLITLKASLGGDDPLPQQSVASFYAYVIHPFFQLPATWLEESKSVVENVNVGERKFEESSDSPDIAVGGKVQTPYGDGVVEAVEDGGMYKVQLQYGLARISAANVKPRAELRRRFTSISMPLAIVEHEDDVGETANGFFYGSSGSFLFFRQYHILCDRLAQAKEICAAFDLQKQDSNDQSGTDSSYSKVLGLVHSVVTGSIEPGKFEDECRQLVGPSLYFLSTIDRLVTSVHKIVQGIVADPRGPLESCRLYHEYEKSEELAGLASFLNSAHQMLSSDGMCIRAQFYPGVKKTAAEMSATGTSEGNTKPSAAARWKEPPTVKLVVLDSVRESDVASLNKSSEIATVCPYEIPCGAALIKSEMVNFCKQGQAYPKARPEHSLLSIFRVFHAPVKSDVVQAIKDFQESQSEANLSQSQSSQSGPRGGNPKKQDLPWYTAMDQQLKSAAAAPVVANKEDTEMKD